MIRLRFTAAALISLLLCVATAALWVRSYWTKSLASYSTRGMTYGISPQSGRIFVWKETNHDPFERGRKYLLSQPSRWTFGEDDATYGYYGAPRDEIRSVGGIGWASGLAGYLDHDGSTYPYSIVRVPYWAIEASLVLLTTVFAIRIWRRVKPNHCVRCGYDLRATPERCPECGTAVTKPRLLTVPSRLQQRIQP